MVLDRQSDECAGISSLIGRRGRLLFVGIGLRCEVVEGHQSVGAETRLTTIMRLLRNALQEGPCAWLGIILVLCHRGRAKY